MKKLLSFILSIAVLLSVVGVSAVTTSATTISPDSSLLTDTSDFDEGLSSIAFSEKMITGYNLGNVFETTELRNNYTRPAIANIQDHIKYKETLAGNVEVTEDYIKYLAESGVQAVRVPVTWFNMLEYTGELNGKTYNGEIVDKSVYYANIDERRKLWYNGVINEEFINRVQQVVDWIIKYGMYCIINTHHDGACSNNSVNPERFSRTTAGTSGETYNQQTINYLTNIWGQVGERFKNYGSRLLFEPYNEVADETGSMTTSATRMGYAAEVAAAFIQQIRSQGGNNDKRFLVIPNYGGVSFMTNSDALATVRAADTVNDVYNDKIILSSHDYSNSMSGAVNSINNTKTKFNIGAMLTEIGFSNNTPNSSTGLAKLEELYTLTHQQNASCFYWDGGRTDGLTNRYYNCPATAAFEKFVGKEVTYTTLTQSEVLSLSASTQPNWMKLYSKDATSEWSGKYLIITSEKKITSLTASNTSQGYYAINGADNGLVTQFVSDDGENYKMLNTLIPTSWTRLAWSEFNAIGTTYYAEQVDGNYFLDQIGDGLQKYVETGDEMLSTYGGALRNGGYDYNNGNYVSTATTRICYTNKIDVTPNEYYYFTSSTGTRYDLLLRGYDENGNRVCNVATVSKNGAVKMPSNVYKISVTIYDNQQSKTYDQLYDLVNDGTIIPTMYHYVSSETNPDPTNPTQTTEPTQPSSSSTISGESIELKFRPDDCDFTYVENGMTGDTWSGYYRAQNITVGNSVTFTSKNNIEKGNYKVSIFTRSNGSGRAIFNTTIGNQTTTFNSNTDYTESKEIDLFDSVELAEDGKITINFEATSSGAVYLVKLKLEKLNGEEPSSTEPTEPTEPTTQPIDTNIEMTTQVGASIRLNSRSGLRFYTGVDKDKITLIAPYDYLGASDLNFDLASSRYVDVKYTSNEYYEEGAFSGIVGSIVNIRESTTQNQKSGNILRYFVARGYAKITDSKNNTTIVYADYNKDSARSLGFVAYMFKNDNQNSELYLANAEKVDKWASFYEEALDPSGDDLWD